MAAPWPPQHQQGQGQPQSYAFNTYQQTNGQAQGQPTQQLYAPQYQSQQQVQPQYQQKPRSYPQQPLNRANYGQQFPLTPAYPPQHQPYQLPTSQYQHGTPQQQPPSHQIFNQPNSLPSSVSQYTQPSAPAIQHYQYAPGQQYSQPQQSFVPQQPSHSPVQTPNQEHRYPSAPTPQQRQYGPPSSSTTEKSPGSPASPVKDQPQEKKPTVPCYNCGSFEHWAVSCPEPLREVPAGRLNRQNQQPPAKRQKFNAPIITKYSVPPHLAQVQGHPSNQPAPYSHPGYGQAPAHYQVPPTPMSAQSPPGGQWPQTVSYPLQHQQAPSMYPQQAPPPQQYSFAPTPQTPTYNYGPSPVSQASPHAPPQLPGYPPYAQYQQYQQQTVQSYTGAPHYPNSSSTAGVQMLPQTQGQQPAFSTPYQGPPSLPNPSTQSQAVTPRSQSADATGNDDDGDDLNLLDVPDCPAAEDVANPTLVGRPLPTNFVVADALAPFDAPALGDNGRCKSKYFDRSDLNDATPNIKETSEWEKLEKDPIFNDVVTGGTVILLSVIDMIYRPARIQDASEDSETEDTEPRARGSNDADDAHKQQNHDGGRRVSPSESDTESLERQGSPATAKQDARPLAASEDILASLGVTGEPKSSATMPRPYPPPTPRDRTGDKRHSSRSHSRSPQRYHPDFYQNISPPDSGADGRPLNEERSTERRQSYYTEGSSRRWSENSSTHYFQHPPPPPPPPARRPAWYDGSGSSPLSPESNYVNPSGYRPDSSMQNGHGASTNHPPPDNHKISPVKLRSERSFSHKREYANREESSDEDETIRRRQADDITPKQKRRQPKVADAYSRRW